MIQKFLRPAFFLALVFSLAAGNLVGQAGSNVQPTPEGDRKALVIGNSAYAVSSLKNPANDATDVAAALTKVGFQVQLEVNRSLSQMDDDLVRFQSGLKPGDVALLYYAGHGVQAEGENYLLPIDNDGIRDSEQLKRRAKQASDYVKALADAGTRLNIVILDACRNNPLPAVSRSAQRGLTTIAVPLNSETAIIFSTKAGMTAADGDGRNSPYTTAFLAEITKPDVGLLDFFNNVGIRLKSVTGQSPNQQIDTISKPFYFVDPALVAARAQAALDKSKSELASLDTAIADLQRQIAASTDAQAKQKLQVEQQRQQALQQAKALEADNLAKEAARQQAAADAAAKLAAERRALQAANEKAQNDLSTLAAARRAELDKLAQSSASDNPDVLIDTVERLEVVLKEVDGQYAAALRKSLDASNAGWDDQVAALSNQKPDMTETDAEFAARIAKEKTDLHGKRQGELASLRKNIEAQRLLQTATIRKQYEETLRTLQTKVWTVTGSGAILTIGAFDRNSKTWPFTVGSADPTIPMLPVNLVAQLGTASDPKTAILALDTAVKANALAAEFDWGITRDAEKNRYAVDLRAVRVRNLTSNEVVALTKPNKRVVYFIAGERNMPLVGTLNVSGNAKDGAGDVYIDGVKVGSLPYSAKMASYIFIKVEVKWPEEAAALFAKTVILAAGQSLSITVADKLIVSVGKKGPAGGLVFYDKGNYAGGWRYLEAAPSDQTDRNGIPWAMPPILLNAYRINIETNSMGIGTGKANTDAINAALAPVGGIYAATLCKNLTINGFSDWFLPSSGELHLMLTNLGKAGLGGFGKAWYWSSSKPMSQPLILTTPIDGLRDQNYGDLDDRHAVRACRAF